jgi:hypothetical protein
MLGAAAAMGAQIPHLDMDAVEGRQARAVFADISAWRADHRLAPTVVIHTGDNGIVSPTDLSNVLHSLADRRRIVVLTDRVPRDWEAPNNQTLRSVVSRFPNAVLVDWYHESAGHSDWFYDDGIHLRPAGARAYAQLVAAAVG